MVSTSDYSPMAPATTRSGAGRFWIAFNDAWRRVTLKEIVWTLAIGLTFTVANAYTYASSDRNWPFLVRSWEWLQSPSCLVLLLAFRMAEHPQLAAIPQWRRYAIVIPPAALLYFAVSTGIWAANLSEPIPSRYLAMHLIFTAVQALSVTVIVAIVYSSLMRSRRSQAAFDAAALQRAATARRVAAARLATLQAQIDPALLFSTLELAETLYERDPEAAERTLAELIDFLRTALPKVGEEGSTLERELHLARAYLGIVGARMGSRLDARFEIPRELDGASFPAMVLVPLVEHAVRYGLEPLTHGGRLEIRAAKKDDYLEVNVAYSGADDRNTTWLDPLYERLDGLYGDGARLSVTTAAHGPVVTVEVPYEAVSVESPAIPAATSTAPLQ
jgi:hypothetical protein